MIIQRKNPLLIIALALGLASVGFSLGAFISSEFVVRPGDGMTAGATVATFAFGGLILGLVAAVLLSRALGPGNLAIVSLLSLFAGLAILGVALVRGVSRNLEQRGPNADGVPQMDAQGNPVPPPLPATGVRDSLIGLVTVPVESLPRFEKKGVDYETLAVAVYGSRPNWYLVGVEGGGRAWMHKRVAGRFYPLDEVVVDRLNYMTPSWDARVRENINPDSPSRSLAVTRYDGEVPGKVLEVGTAGGALSFKVEIYEKSPCETTGPPTVIGTGWVRAWAADGQPNVWFYSRGC
jgi:hypothetical protein